MTLQIFAEYKKDYDNLSVHLLNILRKIDKASSVSDVRIFRKYVIEGVLDEHYDFVRDRLICDMQIENIFFDYLPITSEYRAINIKPQKNQFNKDIEKLTKSFKLLGLNYNNKIEVSTVICVGKGISETVFDSVKRTVLADGLDITDETKKPIKKYSFKQYIDGFIEMNDIEIYQFHRKNNIRMLSTDLCKVRNHFKSLDRDPMRIELAIIDSCWANQNRTKQTELEEIEIKDSPLNIPIEIALDEYITARNALYGDKKIPMTFSDLENIGIYALKQKGLATDVEHMPNGKWQIQIPVDIEGVYEQWIMTFKSSKCANAHGFDYYCDAVGDHFEDKTAAYQAIHLNCFGFDNVKSGKRSVNELRHEKSCSDYLSETSVATGSYNSVIANSASMHIEFAASAAAAPKSNTQKSSLSSNDCIFLLGGKLNSTDLASTDFVQKHNSDVKAKFKLMLSNSKASSLIKRCKTVKNGLVPAVLDITEDGVIFDNDRITANSSVDICNALSMQSDRIIVLCDKKSASAFLNLAQNCGLTATNIAVTTDDPNIKFYSKGSQVTVFERKLLTYKSPAEKTDVIITSPRGDFETRFTEEFLNLKLHEAFLKNLIQYNYNDNSQTASLFDSTASGNTVLVPYGGKYQLTPEESTVCKLPTGSKNTSTVTVMSYGATPKITAVSPFHGAAFSIMEALSKIVACGGNSLDVKLAFSEHFVDPATAPVKWSEPVGAMLGAFEAQMSMGLPSLDNTVSIDEIGNFKTAFAFNAFAVATSKSNDIISAEFKQTGSTVLLIPMPIVSKTKMPDFDRAKILYRQFHYLSQSSKVLSASVVKAGGVANAVAKMSFGNRIGVKFDVTDFNTLFGMNAAALIVETKNPGAFSGMDTVIIGKTIDRESFILNNIEVPLSTAQTAFFSSEKQIKTLSKSKIAEIPACNEKAPLFKGTKLIKPKVLIPIFDAPINALTTANSFERANGEVNIFNFDYSHKNESFETLAANILKSQIIALPNSKDDKLSVNLNVIALSSPKIKDAIQAFLAKGGLILGLGSGFNVLLKTGLLGINPNHATFAPNITANVASSPIKTRISSVKTPWMNNCKVGDVHTISMFSENSRFVADEVTLSLLSSSGRIISQYVDISNLPTLTAPFNPNGSALAIEGIISPNGAIFGKSSLSDRYSANTLININGSKNQHIFDAGVQYFM